MLHICLQIVCSIAALLVLLDFYIRNYTKYKIAKQLPSPPMLPIIGSTQLLLLPQEKSFQTLNSLCKKYENGFAYWSFGIFIYNVYSADSIEKIVTNSKHIAKSFAYTFLHQLLGTGLLNSTGEKWFARRKLLTPTFHFNILNGFQQTFNEQTKILLEEIKEKEVNRPNGTHLQKLISRFTLNNICESAMGVKPTRIDELDDYRKQINEVKKLQMERMNIPWFLNDWLYNRFGTGELEKSITDQIHSFTGGVIKTKRNDFKSNQQNQPVLSESHANSDDICYKKNQRLAMLDTLLVAEQNNLIDSAGVQEEVDTFIFGGFDTTMTAITFTLFAIANDEDVQNRLYEEIAAMGEDQNYNQLKYLDAVIKESLRMFPSAPVIGRVLGEDTIIDGVNLPAGTTVRIHIHALHRDPKYFPDPDDFNPDRFLENKIEHPFAYIPFSAGQRNCIGQKFAMMEVRTAIGEIVKNFELEPITEPEDVVIVHDLIYRSKDPIRIQFVPRKDVM